MDSFVSPRDEIRFMRVCHHISNAVYSMYVSYWRLKVEFYTIKTYGEIDVQQIAMNSAPCHLIKVIRQPHDSDLSSRSPYA